MSGHSKWANIRFRKERQDFKKSRYFSKLSKDISIAVKLGGPDPETNPRLRIALETAKSFNLPKENIEKAIKRGTGELEGSLEEFEIEGYGPGGIAVLIEVLTSNRNRALNEIRSIFNKFNSKIAEAGGVKWMFERKGKIVLSKDQKKTKEELEASIINSPAEDYKENGQIIVFTDPQKLDEVRMILENDEIQIESMGLCYIPKTFAPNSVDKEKVKEFINSLEQLEEVSSVYTNVEL